MANKSIDLIMENFKKISMIPRCSKHEEKIADYLIEWAKKNGFDYKKDGYNNVLIKVPAADGFERAESIAIQGHMDMVCEKTSDSKHDFSKDPIKIITDGDWIMADKTTLGADDGIAVAIGLSLGMDKNIGHPQLELLFTADEETGMNGAKNLSSDFFSSRKLINIDSEKEGVFTIGCAGGEDTDIILPIERGSAKNYYYEITINGLLSGHSGIDIDKNRANAIKLMSQLLKFMGNFNIFLCSIEGGSARNAIPKSSRAVICCDNEINPDIMNKFHLTIKKAYENEKNLTIQLKRLGNADRPITNSQNIINLIEELPHGVFKKTENNITETSNNLAKISTFDDEITISTNQRSLSEDGINIITKQIEEIADRYKAQYKSFNNYPSWKPNFNSELLKKSKNIYRKLFSVEPEIKVIHAGLECGIIGSKIKNIDMISLGPTIEDVHTPNEKLYVPSLEKIWTLLIKMLKTI